MERSWDALRSWARAHLAGAGISSAEADARWLTETASGCSGGEWLAIERSAPTPGALAHLEQMVDRRIAGEPLQYVLGSWSFRSLELMIDPRVLIPRPETEWVVEVALREAVSIGLTRGPSRRPIESGDVQQSGAPHRVADLGTGSGAIALALASELPRAQVWATDAYEDALAVARANGAGNGIGRVTYALGDWYAALPLELAGRLDLVVSNPPYIADDERTSLDREIVTHEPAHALFGGIDGLDALRRIIADAPRWLRPGGAIVVEHAPHQVEAVAGLAGRAGLTKLRTEPDLAGRPRALVARRPSPVGGAS